MAFPNVPWRFKITKLYESLFGLPFRRVQLRHRLQLKSCKVSFVHTYKVSFVHNYFLIEELIWYGGMVSLAPSPTASRRHESGEIPLLAHQDLSHRYQTMNKFQSVDQLGFSGSGLIGGIWKRRHLGRWFACCQTIRTGITWHKYQSLSSGSYENTEY